MRVPDELSGLTTDPFVVFEIEDFLSVDEYKQLEASFPQESEMPYQLQDSAKSYVDNRSPEFGAFLDRHQEWAQVARFFAKPVTVNRLYRLTRPHLEHRSPDERKPWRLVEHEGLRSRFGRTNVTLGVETSILRAGAFIPPHTDTPSKVLSLMLYFPEDGAPTDGLGTEFYRSDRREWISGLPDREESEQFWQEYECFRRVEFAPRTLVGFVKTDSSWHGVHPIESTGPLGRRALVINYYVG